MRGRVALLGTVVLAAWLLVVVAGFALVLEKRLEQQIDDALRVRAQAASSTVRVENGRVTDVDQGTSDSAFDTSTWIYVGGTARERPRLAPELQRVADRLAPGPTGFHRELDHEFFVLPVRSGGRRIATVVVALDHDPYERTRDVLLVASVVLVALLLVGAYPVLRYGVRRALAPVEAMSAQAARWGAADTDRRFGAQSTDELSALAASLDALLDRLAGLIRHERHLSAELSHELRTPLARMLGELDLMLETAPTAVADDLRRIRADGDAMVAIIDTLMAAARGELGPALGRTAVADVLTVLADGDTHGRPVRTSVTPPDLHVGVDRDVVLRTLEPIVANARRFATSLITLDAHRVGTHVVIDVRNDGPAVPVQDLERVFEPGHRGPDGPDHGGAGLGLPLARRLARAADGDVIALEADGAHFVVRLPAG